MSWASDKAQEICPFGAYEVGLGPTKARDMIERAILETIDRCAREVDDSMTVDGAAEHVRALAGDNAEVGSGHRVGRAFKAPIVEVDPPHYINGSDSCLVCGERFPPGSSTTGSCPGRWVRP